MRGRRAAHPLGSSIALAFEKPAIVPIELSDFVAAERRDARVHFLENYRGKAEAGSDEIYFGTGCRKFLLSHSLCYVLSSKPRVGCMVTHLRYPQKCVIYT